MNNVLRVVALAIALAVLTPSRTAQAQEIPAPVMIDVPLIQQETRTWCWLAVSEMLVQHYNGGMSLPQCMMLDIVTGEPAGTCCRNPETCLYTADSLAVVQLVMAQFGGILATRTAPLPAPVLYGTLQLGHPVVAWVTTGGSCDHLIVIRGMRFEPTFVITDEGPTASLRPILLVNDPMLDEPIEMSYDSLRSIWLNALIIDP